MQLMQLGEYKSIDTHWIALYVNDNSVTYLDNFGTEKISKKNQNFLGKKNIIKNIFSIQDYELDEKTYICIRFIDFVFRGKRMADLMNLLLPDNFKNYHEVILNY